MMSYIGKGSCWDLHWVFKPRQASMRPVVSHIKFSYKINSVWDLCRTALWWQRIISILCQCRRDCLVCWLVCVCVLPGKAAEQQQDCLFPHSWIKFSKFPIKIDSWTFDQANENFYFQPWICVAKLLILVSI